MTAPVEISEQPSVTAVGHQGARVEIQERPARATSGWLGVLVVLVCIGAVIGLAYTSVRGLVAIPILIGLIVGASLAIVQPGRPALFNSSDATSARSVRPVCRGCCR
jgi:predicted lipid-binding transport protein (Tim44 family)